VTAALDTITSAVSAVERKRDAVLEEASASILRSGWSPADCQIEVDTVTKRHVLRVRNVAVFEVTETWTDTKATISWRWIAEIPEREGFRPASA
jgi:hypothetical protein